MNYKLIISYDGGRYDGWQKQGNTDNTIQGKLESILKSISGEDTELHGAGRTDAGVHALAQCASFRLSSPLSPEYIARQLNRYLPEDIAVLSVEEAPERFHARLNARGKHYRYSIRMGAVPDVFRRKYQYRVEQPLDFEAMKKAASLLVGCHDFRAFCSNKRYKKSTVRTLRSIDFSIDGSELNIDYRGDGFLYNMVRILTGTLIEVGLGEKKAEDIPSILESLDRQCAGKTAPAQGLCLVEVEY